MWGADVCLHGAVCFQASDQRMRDMMDRLESTENRQNTIVSFLARLAQNPTVLQQMVSVAQNVGLQRSLNDGRNGGEATTSFEPAQSSYIAKCFRSYAGVTQALAYAVGAIEANTEHSRWQLLRGSRPLIRTQQSFQHL